MKSVISLLLLIATSIPVISQNLNSYDNPIKNSVFSSALKDSVQFEIIVPKSLGLSDNIQYPVIYLLDRQNSYNYNYNLYTIDYLTTLNEMPPSIVIGISFNNENRGKWTQPNMSGGRADDFISFLSNELNYLLNQDFLISSFNLLIGHSRTAIFSSYALSNKYDFFNGAIASSTSYFDFGDSIQENEFEQFLKAIPNISHKYHLYFSSGERDFGDGHESSVEKLNNYLLIQNLPINLHWKYYKEKVGHFAIPGLTVNRALNVIFVDYKLTLRNSFKILNDTIYSGFLPWDKYLEQYEIASKAMGYSLQPDMLFFNSIASAYINDYNDQFGDKKYQFALEILLEGIKLYPYSYDLNGWISKIYLTLGEIQKADEFQKKAIDLIRQNQSLNEYEILDLIKELETVQKYE